MEGSHSPFGFIWQIASATGWSHHHIMWKINYPALMLMLSDAPRWVNGKKKKKGVPGRNPRKASNTVAMFESRMKKQE